MNDLGLEAGTGCCCLPNVILIRKEIAVCNNLSNITTNGALVWGNWADPPGLTLHSHATQVWMGTRQQAVMAIVEC